MSPVKKMLRALMKAYVVGSARERCHSVVIGSPQARPRMDSSLPETRKNMTARAIRPDAVASVFFDTTPTTVPIPEPMRSAAVTMPVMASRFPVG